MRKNKADFIPLSNGTKKHKKKAKFYFLFPFGGIIRSRFDGYNLSLYATFCCKKAPRRDLKKVIMFRCGQLCATTKHLK
jgi:hypothetical protein